MTASAHEEGEPASTDSVVAEAGRARTRSAFGDWWRDKLMAQSLRGEPELTSNERKRAIRAMQMFDCPSCRAKTGNPCWRIKDDFDNPDLPPTLTRPHPNRLALLDQL